MKIAEFEKSVLRTLVARANTTKIPADCAAAIAYAAKVAGVSYDMASAILAKAPFNVIPADKSALGAKMIVEQDNSHIPCRPLGPTMVGASAVSAAFS